MRNSFKINISYITETMLTNESKQKRHDSVWTNHWCEQSQWECGVRAML